jgi:hypothetical protein
MSDDSGNWVPRPRAATVTAPTTVNENVRFGEIAPEVLATFRLLATLREIGASAETIAATERTVLRLHKGRV